MTQTELFAIFLYQYNLPRTRYDWELIAKSPNPAEYEFGYNIPGQVYGYDMIGGYDQNSTYQPDYDRIEKFIQLPSSEVLATFLEEYKPQLEVEILDMIGSSFEFCLKPDYSGPFTINNLRIVIHQILDDPAHVTSYDTRIALRTDMEKWKGQLFFSPAAESKESSPGSAQAPNALGMGFKQ